MTDELFEKCLLTPQEEKEIEKVVTRKYLEAIAKSNKSLYYHSTELERAVTKALNKARLTKAIPIIKKALYEEWEPAQIKAEQLIKAEARKAERKRIASWGIETCPHTNKTIMKDYKRECHYCWSTLKGEDNG